MSSSNTRDYLSGRPAVAWIGIGATVDMTLVFAALTVTTGRRSHAIAKRLATLKIHPAHYRHRMIGYPVIAPISTVNILLGIVLIVLLASP